MLERPFSALEDSEAVRPTISEAKETPTYGTWSMEKNENIEEPVLVQIQKDIDMLKVSVSNIIVSKDFYPIQTKRSLN